MPLQKASKALAIKQIEAKDTYAVRLPVLRPGRPIEDCEFNNDTHKDTFHLGLYLKSNLIGVVTFIKTNHDAFTEKKQYQLRGMAILEAYQGLKYGDLLIQAGESLVQERHGELIWLNAREIAVRFYERNEFKVHGEAFNIPQVGLHYMMHKTV